VRVLFLEDFVVGLGGGGKTAIASPATLTAGDYRSPAARVNVSFFGFSSGLQHSKFRKVQKF
jgi:hypothetical protein